MPLAPGTRLGSYEIVTPLGAGGMGEVYRARDTRLDRTVAIKVLPAALGDHPELRQRLEREARAISSLDHPHICALYDIGRERPQTAAGDAAGELDFLVMQHLEGETLADRLRRGGALRLDEALKIGAQIAEALAAAHRRGIVHRDLKPGNVMLTKGGARLLDFGLAKQADAAAAPSPSVGEALTMAAPLTGERTIVGTLQYMAPEQLEGRAVDARTDIFALGAVLHEMLTGVRAFDGSSSASVMAAILTTQPRAVSERLPVAPPALDRIVGRCLAKEPDERWQSAADLAYELSALPGEVGAPPAAAVRRATPALAIGIGLVTLAAAAAAYWAWQSKTTPSFAVREIRLSLLPPPGHEFATDVADYDPDFSLSPDGTQVAFSAVNARGERQIWVRSLDSLEARPLQGTERASSPFWSPDGDALAFFGPGGLARLSLSGGAPQVLANAQWARAPSLGTWGSGGQIIFERTETAEGVRGLAIVAAAGGEARDLDRGKYPEGELGQRCPQMLADGRRYVYLSWTAEPEQRALHLGSLDSPERRLIVKTGFCASIVEPDTLVYVRDRVLVAQRLDFDAAALVGEPQRIVAGLALEAIPGQATYVASRSGVVAYRARSRNVASEMLWRDRTGRVLESIATGSDITMSLSPDDRRSLSTRLVSGAATEERLPANIWLTDLVRRIPSRVTLDPGAVDENPIWSPDGRQIAYAAHRGGGLADVRVVGASESGAGRAIVTGTRNFHPVDWSPDGRTILVQAYATGTGADDIDLWTIPADGSGAPQPFVGGPRSEAQGQFSPDGRWVAYMSDESGEAEVYVKRYPAGDGRWRISANGGAQPRWRGDGEEIFYVTHAGTVMAVPLRVEGQELVAGSPMPLFSEPSLRINNSVYFYGGAAGYDVSRDGQRLLVNRLTTEPTAGPIQIVIGGIR